VEFRQKALAKLQSPEELDLPVRFARPQGWLALAVSVAVLAAAGVWAVTGTVTSKLSAAGVLTRTEGSYVLQSPVAGQVVQVRAKPGDTLPAGAPLLDVRTATGVQSVHTVAAGQVVTLTAAIGAVITTGTTVATVERAGRPGEPLVAMLYVRGSTARVPVGAAVELSVPSVPARYGVLRGTVAGIGQPQSRQQITTFLGDATLAGQFTADGAPVPVLVKLQTSASAPSGYRWSKAGGPPQPLASLTPVGASVRLAAERPLDWLLP
jgi:pyruvate/2-oxoglutarate dehydrogenase complex dihydrolipoamide acyltransferase (E2) component